MKIIRCSALVGLTVSLTATSSVFAQNAAPVIREVAPDPARVVGVQPVEPTWRVIQLRNTMPSSLAHKVDPQHNKAPASEWIKTVRASEAVKLPGAIERVVPVDGQGLLLVKGGSEADARALEPLVKALDKRPTFVEVKLTFVEISAEDAQQLGINYAAKAAGSAGDATIIGPQIGTMPGDFQQKLNALTVQGKARLLHSPRSTSPDNSELRVEVTGHTAPIGAPDQAVAEHINFSAKRYINDDGTLRLNMEIFGNEGVKEHAIVNFDSFRAGETVALSGFAPLFAQPDSKEAPRNVVTLFTARIVPASEMERPGN